MGSATLSLFFLQPKDFSGRLKLARAFWQHKTSGQCLICWPRECRSFHMREKSVNKISLPTKRRFQLRMSQLFPEAWQLLSYSLKPSRPTKPGTIQMTLQNFPRRKTRKGREGRGANTVPREESPPTRGPSCTRPPNLAVCPQASVFPSLGLHHMKVEPHYLCAGRQAPPTLSSPSPNYPCCTVSHPQTPNAHHNPALLPSWASLPTALPRAWNKLPIMCITPHDSSLYTSNHFSISFCKIHQK